MRQGLPGVEVSGLFDLTEIEFHRCRAAEDRDRYAHLAFLVVDVFNVAVEIRERTFLDANHFAHFKEDLGPGFLDTFFHLRKDFLDFAIGDGSGTVARAAQKTGYPIRVLYQVPGFVREVHFDQHIAWKCASLGDRLFTALDFDDFFGGNENAPEGGLESRALDTLEKSLVHAFFHSGINVYDIPTLAHVCPLFPAEQQA